VYESSVLRLGVIGLWKVTLGNRKIALIIKSRSKALGKVLFSKGSQNKKVSLIKSVMTVPKRET
jgi:hypothetical protein